MNNQEVRKPRRKTITIQGHQVTLYFAEQPNPKVAEQVKQALLYGVSEGQTHSSVRESFLKIISNCMAQTGVFLPYTGEGRITPITCFFTTEYPTIWIH